MDTKKFAMNYGAFLGIILVLLAVLIYVFGIEEESVIPVWLNNGAIILFITYAIFQYKNIYQNGFISYSTSLKLGTTVAFFASVILAFYNFIFITYINPDFLAESLATAEQAILNSNPEISEEELELFLDMTNKLMQPHWLMMMGMLSGTFMGFIYSAIISLFTKNPDPNKIG